jgi:hypothetical protein
MFKKIFIDFLHIPTQYRSSPLSKLFRVLLMVFLTISISESSVQAHPGRTDSNGGHHVTATGEYHYHHGYSAHQHPNGICPYDTTTQTLKNNNSNSRSSSSSGSDHSFLIGVSSIGVFFVSYCLKAKYNEIQGKKQFEREKLHYSNLYKGKSINELANVPKNIDFDENDLPISVDNSGLKWGKEFTVFVSKYGQCYHRYRGCSSAYNTVHIFNEIKKYKTTGCRKCSAGEKYIMPEWYYKYIEIKKIKNRYGI